MDTHFQLHNTGIISVDIHISIGCRTRGEGGCAPTKFYVGGQCLHNILQQQAHYSGVHGHLISEKAT